LMFVEESKTPPTTPPAPAPAKPEEGTAEDPKVKFRKTYE